MASKVQGVADSIGLEARGEYLLPKAKCSLAPPKAGGLQPLAFLDLLGAGQEIQPGSEKGNFSVQARLKDERDNLERRIRNRRFQSP